MSLMRKLSLAIAVLSAASVGAAGEPKLSELEERLRSVERELREKDAEIARLREELERFRAEPREDVPMPLPDPGDWQDRIDRMLERMRKELEEWGMEWGLPGRRFNPPRAPRHVQPWEFWGSGAYLGIEMEETADGVAVKRVLPASPAERAGLKAGDVLLELDGSKVSTSRDVVEHVGRKRPGEKISILVLRAGKKERLTAVLGSRLGGGGLWFGMGRQQRPSVEGDTIELEVDIPGGRASVSFSAPGLHLSEELAKKLKLTDKEREAVEKAFARAREKLAKDLARQVEDNDGALDAGIVAEKRLAAEKRALDELKNELPAEKLEALKKAQEELASKSQVSVSVTRGWSGGKGKEKAKRRSPGTEEEAPQEF